MVLLEFRRRVKRQSIIAKEKKMGKKRKNLEKVGTDPALP
jgi:hypothetical protein